MLDAIMLLDWEISRYFISRLDRYAWLDSAMLAISSMDLVKGVPFMCAAWVCWLIANQQRRAVDLVATALLAMILSRLVQNHLPGRVRPLFEPALGAAVPNWLPGQISQDYSSLPSDHAVLFFAMSVALLAVSRTAGVLGLLWSTAVVCFPRLYLGFHYLSDLFGGALLGIAIALAYRRWIGEGRLAHLAIGAAQRWPAAFHSIAFVLTFELGRMMAGLRGLGVLALAAARKLG